MKTIIAVSDKGRVSSLMLGGAVSKADFVAAADVVAVIGSNSSPFPSPGANAGRHFGGRPGVTNTMFQPIYDVLAEDDSIADDAYFVQAVEFDVNSKQRDIQEENIKYDIVLCLPFKSALAYLEQMRESSQNGPQNLNR